MCIHVFVSCVLDTDGVVKPSSTKYHYLCPSTFVLIIFQCYPSFGFHDDHTGLTDEHPIYPATTCSDVELGTKIMQFDTRYFV